MGGGVMSVGTVPFIIPHRLPEPENSIKLSPLSAAYMLIGSALVQVMACRLLGAKPLSKPMLGYCQLDPLEQTLLKF